MPTALIVEDEPAANQLLAMLIQLRGYKTVSAFTGDEAIRAADASRPDLVFLDLMLPDITGYQVCKALKAKRATHAIPVVMVTARLAEENRLQGYRAGAVDFVPKPYTPDQIFRAITRADAWRASLESVGESATWPIDAGDEARSIQACSSARCLLLARTGLDEPSVAEVASALLKVLLRALASGRDRGVGHVADLTLRLEPGRFELLVRDRSGWLRDGEADRLDLAGSGFEAVDSGPTTTIRLARALPGVAPSA